MVLLRRRCCAIEKTARRFLSVHAMSKTGFDPALLTGAEVNAFLLGECGRVSAGSAKGRVAELRSMLRFLYLAGRHTRPAGDGGAAGRWVAAGHHAADR